MADGRTEVKVVSAGVVDVNIVLHNVKKSLHFWFKNDKNLRLNWDYSETKKKKVCRWGQNFKLYILLLIFR